MIKPGSLRQPRPPAPDLIAEIHGQGAVAFELVRINAPEQLAVNSLRGQSFRLLSDEFEKLDAAQHQRLSALYADGYITLLFRGPQSLARRREALPFLWSLLESLPVGFRGKADLYGKGAPSALEMVYVSRIKTRGVPEFRCISCGYAPLPAIDEIAGKLTRKKRYECREPLELLAYLEWGELSHARSDDDIQRLVCANLPTSQFRRVWIFEGLLKRTVLTFPTLPG